MTARMRNDIASELRKASHTLEFAENDLQNTAIVGILIKQLYRLNADLDERDEVEQRASERGK